MKTIGALVLLFLQVAIVLGLNTQYYDLLGITNQATEKQIKKAFRKLSLKWHPDKHPGDKAAQDKFTEISNAYETLMNPDTRQIYDIDGVEGLERHRKEAAGGGGNSMFDMFGFGGGGRGRRKGPDYRMEYQVNLEDLYNGGERSISITRNVLCKKCRGTGAKGGDTKRCPKCKGQGVVMSLQEIGPGFRVQMQNTCDKCGGKGNIAKAACPDCRGKKIVKEAKSFEFELERGMPNGHEIKFERASEQSPNTTPGDVILILKTKAHKLFTRDGSNLRMDVTITLKEALLGFSREFTHLDGHTFTVENSGVTYPGQVLKLEDEGMPVHEISSDKGHLFVTMTISFPRTLSQTQQDALAQIL